MVQWHDVMLCWERYFCWDWWWKYFAVLWKHEKPKDSSILKLVAGMLYMMYIELLSYLLIQLLWIYIIFASLSCFLCMQLRLLISRCPTWGKVICAHFSEFHVDNLWKWVISHQFRCHLIVFIHNLNWCKQGNSLHLITPLEIRKTSFIIMVF